MVSRLHRLGAVFLGRLVPAVRTPISAPAGADEMPSGRFFVYSAPGTTTWSGVLADAGHLLENRYRQISTGTRRLTPSSAQCRLWYIYRVVAFKQEKSLEPRRLETIREAK
ncbi:MAG: DedA family protein [Methylocystis sp.]|uniref:DedA family protein n=1 Tax=Methylocystis sp. TaxID=1911079 RepID=UPI003D138F05